MTCIENFACPPDLTQPMKVLDLYDIQYGAGMSLVVLGIVLGVITLAIYVRTRSMPMLVILGFYEIAAFASILTSKYISSQYHIMEYVIIFGMATAVTMLVLRLVKE